MRCSHTFVVACLLETWGPDVVEIRKTKFNFETRLGMNDVVWQRYMEMSALLW